MNTCVTCDALCLFSEISIADSAGEREDNITEITFKKGESVCKQGMFISHLFYIKKGLVKQVIEGNQKKSLTIRIIKEGFYSGFSLLNTEFNYPFSLIALENVRVCVFKRSFITEILNKHANIKKKIFHVSGNEINFLYKKLLSVGTKQMHGRLADSLLYLTNQNFEGKDIFKLINRKDIAELSGMSAESTIKILNELKNDKVIKINGKKIEIIDRKLIEQLSKIG